MQGWIVPGGRLVCGLLGVVLVAGCGSKKIPVRGQLQHQGKSLTIGDKGWVEMFFYSLDQSAREPYLATVNTSDATFEVKDRDGSGLPPGKYKVTIRQAVPYPQGPDKWKGRFSRDKSKLVVEVTDGSNPLNIDLASP